VSDLEAEIADGEVVAIEMDSSALSESASPVPIAKQPRLQPHLYINRELGQLEFNRRVLAQAADPNTPLLERLKFLCIFSSNLDEFFEIRVAGVQAEIEAGTAPIGPDRMRPQHVFEQVSREAHALVA
jgi:polyphosphate kinase